MSEGRKTRKKRPAIDRFMEKVGMSGDCWEWTGRKFWDGYGDFFVDGKSVRAHRWSYEHHVGPIAAGLVVDHLCRNRACVNPEHLEPVTNRENLLRGVGPSALAAAATHCPAGHPYEGDTYRVNLDGTRACRVCAKAREKDRRSRGAHRQECPYCGDIQSQLSRHVSRKHKEESDAQLHG